MPLMKRKNVVLLCLALLLLPFAETAVADLNDLLNKVDTYSLKNGLQVVLLPQPRAPVVYHGLWYKTGSSASPETKTGIAHFVEHMMFKGTKRFPKDTFKRRISDLGGEQNASTSWDRTDYFVMASRESLPQIMALEADRMKNIVLSSEELEKERDVVLQERRMRVESSPYGKAQEASNAAFFWEHPYGKPIIGFEEHIRRYTLEDVRLFYTRWYVPNNALLVIVGDIHPVTLKPLIERYYGGIPSQTLPVLPDRAEPPHLGAKVKIEIRDPQGGPSFDRIYRAPNYRTGGIKTEAALVLLDKILGDPVDGRLNLYLKEKRRLANFIETNYTGGMKDPFSFTLSAAPFNLTDLALLESSIDAELHRVITDGVTEMEVAKAKQQNLYAYRYQNDSLSGVAAFLGENLAAGYTLEELRAWPATLQAVSLDEIQATAKTVFSPGPDVTVYITPTRQKE